MSNPAALRTVLLTTTTGREHDNRLAAAAMAMGMDVDEVADRRSDWRQVRKRTPTTQTGPAPEPPPLPPAWPLSRNPVLLADLETHHCRFPVGEGELQLFCGEAREKRQPYCQQCLDRVSGKIINPNARSMN